MKDGALNGKFSGFQAFRSCLVSLLLDSYCREHVHVESSFLSDSGAFPSGSSNGLRHSLVRFLLKRLRARCEDIYRSDNGAARRFKRTTSFRIPLHWVKGEALVTANCRNQNQRFQAKPIQTRNERHFALNSDCRPETAILQPSLQFRTQRTLVLPAYCEKSKAIPQRTAIDL